jgi:tyrosine phenol-lyase
MERYVEDRDAELMAIEPYRTKVVEPIPRPSRDQREAALRAADWNLFRIPSDLVTIDLLTDSGTTAMSARQWAGLLDGDESYAGSRSFAHLEHVVSALTGHRHIIPTHQGRAAERLLFEVLVHRGDVVPGNTHFDTTRANIEWFGARAVDLPTPAARILGAEYPFKGDVDLVALAELLAEHGPRIPLVIMTITSNAVGGQPVSYGNLAAVRKLCDHHGVRLFLDAARFAENAWLVSQRDPQWKNASPRAVARAFFDLADGCLMSGKKDALVNIGGFLSLRDDAVAEDLRRTMVLGEGFPTYGGLAGRDLDGMARGLVEVLDPAYLADRVSQIRELADTLHAGGVPIVRPAGGHAVYIDARAFAPHLDALDYPGQSLTCELYRVAGVRGVEVGQLMRGRPDERGLEAAVDHDLVRLAIPRRVYSRRQLAYVADAVLRVHARRDQLPALDIVQQAAALRHFGARLAPRGPDCGSASLRR